MAPRADLRIEPLTAERFDALAELFRGIRDPRWCWCMFWRLRSKDFSAATVAQNRARLHDLAASPLAPGLVAFRGGAAIGWCSLGPHEDYERLERSRIIPRVDDQAVWSIVCFVVSSSARGEGVAAKLLEAATAWAVRHGAKILEAYPLDTETGAAINPDAAYMGTLPMFERAGFRVVSPTGSTSAGRPRVVVRRDLRSGPSARLTTARTDR
jgi:GNAT superfamily N-acetyltransferase